MIAGNVVEAGKAEIGKNIDDRFDGIEIRHGDLDVEDVLGRQAVDGCRADVVDTERTSRGPLTDRQRRFAETLRASDRNRKRSQSSACRSHCWLIQWERTKAGALLWSTSALVLRLLRYINLAAIYLSRQLPAKYCRRWRA